MITIVPMTEAHVRAIEPQEQQCGDGEAERVRIAMMQADLGPCWAALSSNGVVLAIAGVTEAWEGRGIAWSVLSRHCGPHLLALTRTVRRYLDGMDYARLEMYVDAQFAEGCRWAQMLGFELETPNPMRRFLPNGNGAYLFGRTR